ncbi:Hypothetical predicted protein, partial [Paramuricea clavata]
MASKQHADAAKQHKYAHKPVPSKIPKHNMSKDKKEETETEKPIQLKDIHDMMKAMMTKLEKLDFIEIKVHAVEEDLRKMRDSIEYVHAEVDDLKAENIGRKKTDEDTKQRLEKLQKENEILNKSVIDLKARSMRDIKPFFYNLPESKDEDTTNLIHGLLEEKLDIKDARVNVKIDRSHRLGKPKSGTTRPRPIVAKFNYFQDREQIRRNARKLKGTKLAIGEQFPEKIMKIRKELYPEFKKEREGSG